MPTIRIRTEHLEGGKANLHYEVVDIKGDVLFSQIWCEMMPTWFVELFHKATETLGCEMVEELYDRNLDRHTKNLKAALRAEGVEI